MPIRSTLVVAQRSPGVKKAGHRMYVPSRAPATMAASTGLIGLVVVENSARPPLAAAQVQAMATKLESARPGRQARSMRKPRCPAPSGPLICDMIESNTRDNAPGLLKSARPA